jgi:2-hydroxy-3-oxopropionate reductase
MDNKIAGFVGLGLMGKPMANNLLKSGWDLMLWNRSGGAVADLERLGGRRVAGVAGMRDLPVIVFMLPDLSFIEEAAAPLLASWRASPPLAGTTLVVMSSVSPSRVQEFGREVQNASHGHAAVVDAPVSGGTAGAVEGTLAIMAGGATEDFRRLEPLFRAIGTTVRHLGPLGAGSLAKACNQLIVGTTTAALAEAAELAERSGLDSAALFEVLAGGLAGSQVLELVGPRLLKKDYRPTGPAKFMLKDLTFVLESAGSAGAAVPMAAAGLELYAELTQRGLGDHDIAVVREVISQLSGAHANSAMENSAMEGTVSA